MGDESFRRRLGPRRVAALDLRDAREAAGVRNRHLRDFGRPERKASDDRPIDVDIRDEARGERIERGVEVGPQCRTAAKREAPIVFRGLGSVVSAPRAEDEPTRAGDVPPSVAVPIGPVGGSVKNDDDRPAGRCAIRDGDDRLGKTGHGEIREKWLLGQWGKARVAERRVGLRGGRLGRRIESRQRGLLARGWIDKRDVVRAAGGSNGPERACGGKAAESDRGSAHFRGRFTTTVPSMLCRARALLILVACAACAEVGIAVPELPALPLASADAKRLDARALAADAPFTVFVFFSAHCRCLDAHDARLRALYSAYRARGVQFVMVDSEAGRTVALDREEAERRGYPFPMVRDPEAKLADALGVEYATHTVLTDVHSRVLYRGGIDSDKVDLHENATALLRDALDDVLTGRPPRVSDGKTLGCALRKN